MKKKEVEVEETNNSLRFVKYIFFVFSIILIMILYSRYIGTTGLKVKEIVIKDNNINESYYGYKVVHISDIHYNNTIFKSELKNIVKQTNKYKPDIVVITGDTFDKNISYTDKDLDDLKELLSNIDSQYKYIILGDQDSLDNVNLIIENTGFKLLDNDYDLIYNNDYKPILITGLSSNSDNYENTINDINNYIEQYNSIYNILLIHEPSTIDKISYDNYNLILAGHTLNGSINIPGIKNIILSDSKYTKLHYKYDNTNIYISNGVGTTNIKSRLFNRPSITLYRLINE